MILFLLLFFVICFPPWAFGATATCTWTDNSSGTGQEDNFVLERAPSCSGPWAVVANPIQNSQTYPDSTVTAGSSYCYRIKAVNTAGSSAYNTSTLFTVPGGGTLPGVPSNVTCTYDPTTPPPPPTGLVVAMNFNAGSGTVAADSSGSGNNGTLTNGPTWTTSGKYGNALLFDGANDIVLVNDAASLDLTTQMTLMAWVHPTLAITYWKAILQKEADAYMLMAGSDQSGRPTVGGIFAGGPGTTHAIAPAALAVNTWTHVAGTYDGVRLKIYINGVQVATQSRTGGIQVNANPLRIGGNSYSTEFFKGQIDDVRVYNRALTITEINTDKDTAIP